MEIQLQDRTLGQWMEHWAETTPDKEYLVYSDRDLRFTWKEFNERVDRQDKSGRHMEPFLIDVAPSEDGVDFVLSTHEGEEFIYVLEGVLEINYGKNTYILEEGDSIYYDSIVAHHVHAAADNTAKILGVIYTPY